MLAKSLTTRIKREGFWAAIRDVGGTLLPTRFEVWKLSRENSSARNSAEAGAGILAGPPALENLKRLRDATPGLPVEFYRDEIDGIDRCFLACIDGRPAAIAWAYEHTKPGHFLRMNAGDAEIRSVYSLAEFRGRGLAKAVVAAGSDSLLRGSFQNVYAVIDSRNEPSLKAFQFTGFVRVGELTRPPLFGPRYVTETSQSETWMESIRRSIYQD